MNDDEPPDSRTNSLERKLTTIIVQKNTEPLLSPKMLKGKYSSIRNPGAFTYKDKIGLLCTVRYSSDNKCRLHLAWSENGKDFSLEENPFIDLDPDAQEGVEDSRVSKIGKEYFITFTAYKGYENKANTTRVGLIKTKNFKSFFERKIILDEHRNNKNSLIFEHEGTPWIIDRKFRGDGNDEFSPGARIARIKNLEKTEIEEFKPFLMPRKEKWDNARTGVNTPPIKMKHKIYGDILFMLYHGASKQGNRYQMGYVILDGKNPNKILERSIEPLLSTELDWEIGRGKYPAEVGNVVFGCGAIPIGKNKIRAYYSGGDRYPGFADLTIKNTKIKEQ
ncbi:hypothetical protein KAJ87_01890 [Candidatus Pacearchaeota archaeon]|nr:hypothetical protein [Candidatus Pacearchaeota archaeon]